MTVTYHRLDADSTRARRIAALLRAHSSGKRRMPSHRVAALFASGAGCHRRILGAVSCAMMFHG